MKTGRFCIALTANEREALTEASEALQVRLLNEANKMAPVDRSVVHVQCAMLNHVVRKLRALIEEEMTFGSNGPHEVHGDWVVAWHGDWTGERFTTRTQAIEAFNELRARHGATEGSNHGQA